MASGVYSWCEEHWNHIILLYLRRHRKRGKKNTKTCYLDKCTINTNTLFQTPRKPNIRLSENASCVRLDIYFSALPNKEGKKFYKKTIVLLLLWISDLSVLCSAVPMPCAQVLPNLYKFSFLVLKSGQSDAVEQARNSLGYYFFPREALKNTE